MLFLVSSVGSVIARARNMYRSLRDDRRGATAIEYGLLLAGVAVLILFTIFAVGDELENMFNAVQTNIANSYS